MNAIICEVCGSNDVLKQDGVFVCQHCGTKYTLDEAKKLLGTVKVDKTDETENLLALARRARKDNNFENAEKYYALLLQNDPNNWEASFFQVYYHSAQCKIINISNAAHDVGNNLDSTIRLISNIDDNAEKTEALNTVANYSLAMVNMLVQGANNHRMKYTGVSGNIDEFKDRVFQISRLYTKLESALGKYFPGSDLIVAVEKAHYNYLREWHLYLGGSYTRNMANILAKDIQEKDPSFQNKLGEKKSGGCYVATAVYGSYDCPEVWTLRRYRDFMLAETWYGRLFIFLYYSVSPTLVKWFGETQWFKNMWKPKLDRMVKKLNKTGVADTPYQDRNW